MNRIMCLSVFVLLALFNAPAVLAQSSDEIRALKEDVRAIKEGQAAIQKDLQEIKKLLQAKQAPAEFKEAIIDIQGAPSKGGKEARLVLMEFSDYQ